MIPLRADPNAIATRRKVGIEPDARVRSVSGTLAIIRLETKVHDIPKPIPIKMASKAISQSGPKGMA